MNWWRDRGPGQLLLGWPEARVEVFRHELAEPQSDGHHPVSGIVEPGARPGLHRTQRACPRFVRHGQVCGHLVDRLGNAPGWAVGRDDDRDDGAYPVHDQATWFEVVVNARTTTDAWGSSSATLDVPIAVERLFWMVAVLTLTSLLTSGRSRGS
jgi:hypothetical protein